MVKCAEAGKLNCNHFVLVHQVKANKEIKGSVFMVQSHNEIFNSFQQESNTLDKFFAKI